MPIYTKSAILIFKRWEKRMSLFVSASLIQIENTMQEILHGQLV